MDIFEIPDDYKSEHPLSEQEFKEIENYLVNHPLFIKEVPEDPTAHPAIAALHSLVQDESPFDQASHLNAYANAKMKSEPLSLYHLKEAFTKYTEALKIPFEDVLLRSKIHSNRALVNLKLKNYGKAINDCESAIKYNKENEKGYYRKAQALLGLRKYEECLEFINSVIESCKELKILQESASQEIKKMQKLQSKEIAKKSALEEYCQHKKYRLKKKLVEWPNNAEPEINENGNLSVPILLVYPEFSQSDLIKSAQENDKVWDHILTVIEGGIPWDEHMYYRDPNICAYMQTNEKLIEVRENFTVSDLLLSADCFGGIQLIIVSQLSKKFFNHFSQINTFL